MATLAVYLSRPKVVITTPKEETKPPVVDKGHYFNNVSITGDTVTLSVVDYQGRVGDFENEQITQKWYCPDLDIRKAIAKASIDFHQQPGELKMLATAKGLTNEKYIVNANFAKYIIAEDDQIIKFNNK